MIVLSAQKLFTYKHFFILFLVALLFLVIASQQNFKNVFAQVDDINTTSLLHFDGTNGSTTFTDESSISWTTLGNAHIDTATNKFGTASGIFDGDGDYISTTNNDAYNFTNQDFTIDYWMKSTQTTGNATVVGKMSSGFIPGSWLLHYNNAGAGSISFWLCDYSSATPLLETAAGFSNTGDWVHIALVRYGNVWTIYVNGTARATRTVNITISPLAANLTIGRDDTFIRYYNGSLDEFRVTKGIARWTANFTPPTSAYVAGTIPTPTPTQGVDDSYTKSLLHLNGSNGAGTVTDESGKIWSSVGNVQLTTAQSVLGGSSAQFDGVSDALYVNGGTDFAFGTGDFTVDFWFKLNSATRQSGTVLYDSRPAGGAGFYPTIFISGTKIRYYINGGFPMEGQSVLENNRWYHIALMRSANVVWILLDGKIECSYVTTDTYLNGVNRPILGADGNNPNIQELGGWIDELRVSKGIARWNELFIPNTVEYVTPPVTPTPVPTIGVDDSYTKSLLHFNNFDGSYNFVDESGRHWYPMNNIFQNSLQSIFGAHAAQFDGNSDYIFTNGGNDFTFGTGDFTIDFWFRVNAATRQGGIVFYDSRPAGTASGTYPTIFLYGSALTLYTNGGFPIQGSTVIASDTWYHLALVRAGTNTKMYLNGVQEGSTYIDSNNYLNGLNRPTIGTDGCTPSIQSLGGWIDEMRISKGIARWTTSFTVPTTEYGPVVSNTEPVISNALINSGASTINLVANSTTQVTCSATVTDAEGYSDIESVTAKLFRTSVGINAADNQNDHYTLTGNSECVPSGGSGASENYTCTFDVYSFADPTDSGSPNALDNWTCDLVAVDQASNSSTNVTLHAEMNTLTALDTASSISYGTTIPGSNTGSTNQTTTISNVGNNSIDLQLLGRNMCTDFPTCAAHVLSAGNQQYSFTPFTYGNGTTLTTGIQFIDANLPKPTSSPSTSTLTLYWGLQVPAAQKGGNYTGQNTITAVAN